MLLAREILNKLKENVGFFQNFSDPELLGLLKSTQREVFAAGEIVFKEGTRGEKMYIIVSGSVKISRSIGRNEEEVLATLDTGQLFGEMGPIDQSPRSARATSVRETVLLSLREAILRQNNVSLAYKLYKNFSVMLAERLRLTNERLTDLSASDRGYTERIRHLVKKRIDHGYGLRGVDLRHADLREVFLHNIDLKESLLIHANLSHARFKRVNLQGAHAQSANLSGADLSGTNLSGANLTGADLRGANLGGANLTGANFTASDIGGARRTQQERLSKGR